MPFPFLSGLSISVAKTDRSRTAFESKDDRLVVELPAKSVVVLEVS